MQNFYFTQNGSYGSARIRMGPYRSIWGRIGPYRSVQVSKDPYNSVRVCTNAYGSAPHGYLLKKKGRVLSTPCSFSLTEERVPSTNNGRNAHNFYTLHQINNSSRPIVHQNDLYKMVLSVPSYMDGK